MGYFKISYEKELHDVEALSQIIEQDGWIDSNTTIVVCSPEYSSLACQIINHRLSPLNNHEPYRMDFLEMPYPGEEQLTEEQYRAHCRSLASRHMDSKSEKLLLIDSGVLRGSNFTILEEELGYFFERDQLRFASLYMQDDSKFTPEYCVEKFNFDRDGGLLFWWENENNPFWPW